MGEISDLNYQTLFTTANSFLRLETLRESNDRVSNAINKMPIFHHYDIDDAIHSSSDGQKFETQFSTIGARYSPKYFGLKKGITQYTLVTNHIPLNSRIFGANDHETCWDIRTKIVESFTWPSIQRFDAEMAKSLAEKGFQVI